jgi:O-antigen ligase
LAVEHPLLGVGPGNFQFYYSEHWERPGVQRIRVVHNTYLEIAAEIGSLSLVLFLTYLAVTDARLRAAANQDLGLAGLASAVRASLIVAAVAGFFLSAEFLAPFWLFGGLAQAVWRTGRIRRSPTP